MKRLFLITSLVLVFVLFSFVGLEAVEIDSPDLTVSGSYLVLPAESGFLVELGAQMTPEFYIYSGFSPDQFIQVGFTYEIRRYQEMDDGYLSFELGATMVGDYGGSPTLALSLRSDEDPIYLSLRGGYNYGQISAGIQF